MDSMSKVEKSAVRIIRNYVGKLKPNVSFYVDTKLRDVLSIVRDMAIITGDTGGTTLLNLLALIAVIDLPCRMTVGEARKRLLEADDV